MERQWSGKFFLIGWFAFFFVVGYRRLAAIMLRNNEDKQIKPTILPPFIHIKSKSYSIINRNTVIIKQNNKQADEKQTKEWN